MYYEDVKCRFMNRETVETGNNVEILEEAIKNFKSESFGTVTAYKSHFGAKNDMDLWDEKEWNTYVHKHFFEFEHVLVDICEALSVLVSFKPHKAKIDGFIELLTTNFGDNDSTYYETSFGVGEDIINDVTYDLIDNGHLTEKQAEYLYEKPFNQSIYLNELYLKVANELLDILELNDLDCVFSEANCWGFTNCLNEF